MNEPTTETVEQSVGAHNETVDDKDIVQLQADVSSDADSKQRLSGSTQQVSQVQSPNISTDIEPSIDKTKPSVQDETDKLDCKDNELSEDANIQQQPFSTPDGKLTAGWIDYT